MIKEKIIFISLLLLLVGVLIFGFSFQGKDKDTEEKLLQDIKLSVRKDKEKNTTFKDTGDLDRIKRITVVDEYKLFSERNPFFRVETAKGPDDVKVVRIPVKPDPPRVPLKYKGKVTMGAKLVVAIEETGTGKSFFVQEGDMIGDFQVTHIKEKQVVLKKKNGEEVVLNAVKE